MRFLWLFILAQVAWAQSTEVETMPIKCLFTYGASNREANCTDYRLESKHSVANACVFKNNLWQIGTLTWVAAKKTYNFTVVRTCDRGVVTAKLRDPLLLSPRMADKFTSSPTVVAATGGVKNTVTDVKEPENAVLISCLFETAAGLPTGVPRPCSANPNDATHCWVKDFGAKGATQGKWWVFGARSAASHLVCTGGVLYNLAGNLAKDQGEDIKVTRVRKVFSNAFDDAFLSDIKAATTEAEALNIDDSIDNTYKLKAITGCYVPVNGVDVRKACRNQVAGGDLWEQIQSLKDIGGSDSYEDGMTYKVADCLVRQAYPTSPAFTYSHKFGTVSYIHNSSGADYQWAKTVSATGVTKDVLNGAIRKHNLHYFFVKPGEPSVGIVLAAPYYQTPVKFSNCSQIEYVVEKVVPKG